MPKVHKKKLIINGKTMIVAIDIGKDKSWAIFRAQAGSRLEAVCFYD